MPMTYNPKYNSYIGARYVPLIDGDWDNTKQYEPLTVVLYQGNSYTSKTYVPKGVDINNNSYWVLSGQYNAQIGAIQEQVNQNTSDINTLETNMSGFNGDITRINGDITRINGEIEGLDTRVTALEDGGTGSGGGGVGNLKGVKAVLMGDSLNVDHGWGFYTRNISGLNAQVYGNGSAGFTRGGNTPPFTNMTFEQMLDYLITSVDKSEREKVELFVLLGGINDVVNNRPGISDAVVRFMAKVKTAYPNAKYIVAPLHTFNRLDPSQVSEYSNIYSSATANGAISTTDFVWLCYGWQQWASSDSVHLTDSGYQSLAQNIASFLGGGSVNDNHPIPLTPVDGNNISSNNIYASINKNIITVNGTATYTAPSSATPGRVVLATSPYAKYYAAVNRDCWFYTFAYSSSDSSIASRAWCTFNQNGVNCNYWDTALSQGKSYVCYVNFSFVAGLNA